jgi:hypothetical protein
VKKVLKPQEPEESIYYSDFSGKLLKDFVPVTVKIECDYGSEYDEARIEFHLTDAEFKHLLVNIKDSLSPESKKELKKQIANLEILSIINTHETDSKDS